jgi:glutamine cyclotransferase
LLITLGPACGNNGRHEQARAIVPVVKPVVIRSFAHDTAAFTQGLLFLNGILYESTGLYGHSSLRRVDPADGRVIALVDCDKGVFAEGLAMHDNRLIQLTWREKTAFVYSVKDLSAEGSFVYEGEGWGLAQCPNGLVMSNGTDTLYIRNGLFEVIKKVPVKVNGKPLASLNELEYARGKIFANVWYSNFIFEIEMETGNVTRIIDCTDIVAQTGVLDGDKVLNGIAYDNAADRFFITGKNWPYMFEVEIP